MPLCFAGQEITVNITRDEERTAVPESCNFVLGFPSTCPTPPPREVYTLGVTFNGTSGLALPERMYKVYRNVVGKWHVTQRDNELLLLLFVIRVFFGPFTRKEEIKDFL